MTLVRSWVGPHGPITSSTGKGIRTDKEPSEPEDVLRLADVALILFPAGLSVSLTAAQAVPSSRAAVRVTGDGGPVNLSSNPQVAAGSRDLQLLWILGGDATNTVTLDDGDGLALVGGASVVLGLGDSLHLIWDAITACWRELTRSLG